MISQNGSYKRSFADTPAIYKMRRFLVIMDDHVTMSFRLKKPQLLDLFVVNLVG